MIGYLKGRIIDTERQTSGVTAVTLDINGVGYLLNTVLDSSKIKKESEIDLFVHTHVRDDQITLFGFERKDQLRLFQLLLGVSGVGPKVGIGIVAAASAQKIRNAIASADVSFFTTIPGIGKKGAQKIIIDLKNKIGSIEELDLGDAGGSDIIDALTGMGYSKEKVIKKLRGLPSDMTDEEKIKEIIKKIAN